MKSKSIRHKTVISATKKYLVSQNIYIILFSFLMILFCYLCIVQGYWRHDSWIYTTSELHGIDGRWLAEPLHSALGKVPPEISAPITIAIILIFLLNESKRIAPITYENCLWRTSIVFSVFSSSVLSQLHWPNHALAASIPLLISIPISRFNHPSIKYLRSFIIAFGGFSILTQFAFFSPLCLVECREDDYKENASIHSKKKCSFVRALIFPFIISLSLSIIIGIRSIYSLTGYMPEIDESRLTKSLSIDPSSIFEKIWATTYDFATQQWGYFAIIIAGIYTIMLLMLIAACAHSFRNFRRNYKLMPSQYASNFLLFSFLLIMPILASSASGTQWQRVAICWSSIAVVFMGLIESLNNKTIKKIICLSILIACAYSSFIGISNFWAASMKTRELTENISFQIKEKSTNLFILKINNISEMNPKFSWGGWPPFAKNLRTNPRIFRLFDELQVQDYIILTPDFAFIHRDLDGNCIDLHNMRSNSSSLQILNEYRTCINPNLKNYVDLGHKY